MIYTFRFISDEEESFALDVNINHNQTFEQLHRVIQKTLNYDSNQLASFFTSNEHWEKLHEITLVDMGGDPLVKTMSETHIEDFFSKKDQRLLYVFDYFNERLFFASIVRIIDAESPVELPSVSKLEGKFPPQFDNENTAENMDFDWETDEEDDFEIEEMPEELEDFEGFEQNDY